MNKEKPKYYYKRHMGKYNIYRREEPVNNVETSKKIGDTMDREEAKRRVYELNGWK